jgi:hypothetical protein
MSQAKTNTVITRMGNAPKEAPIRYDYLKPYEVQQSHEEERKGGKI